MSNLKYQKRFFNRLKQLNFFKVTCVSYILFSIFFSIFTLHYDLGIDVLSNDSTTKEVMNKENNIVSNIIDDKIFLNNISISPINLDVSYSSLKRIIDNNQNLVEVEETSQNFYEATTTQYENETISTEMPQNETKSIITEESTTQLNETETIVQNIEQSTELIIDDNSSLEEYINYLINYYSSYNTRIDLNYDNIFLLSRLSIAESEGEILEGKVAVCEVAINRSVTRNQTLYQVIYAKNNYGTPQFSCTIDGRINLTPTKEDVLAAVKAILGEQPTNGSIYFNNPYKSPNSWASRTRKKSVQIGNHQFYYDLPKN